MAYKYEPEYFSGQGRLSVAKIVGGKRGAFRFVGNVPQLEITTDVQTNDHKESHSGQRAVDYSIVTERNVGFNATLEEFTKQNLALALGASVSEIEAKTVSAESLADSPKDGDVLYLEYPHAKDIVISVKGAPLADAAAVEIEPKFGRITVLDASKLAGAVTASYKTDKVTKIEALQENVEGYALRFDGLNTAKGDAPVIVSIGKVQINPAETLSLISDELNSFQLSGKVLINGGKFYDITML